MDWAEENDGIYRDDALSAIWKDRVQKYGKRCVLNLAHPEEAYDLVTNQQNQILFPLLRQELKGEETALLDFGCGPGRLCGHLSRLLNDGAVVGFDNCHELLDLAPQLQNVTYISSSEEMASHRFREYFDVIWICHVLGGISDAKCLMIADALTRNLKPNGLLFLVENTPENFAGNSFWKFRRFAQYREMFPRIPLRQIGGYSDLGNEVTVMSGRRIN